MLRYSQVELLGLFAKLIHADEPDHESRSLSLALEHDLFANADSFYANGIKHYRSLPELAGS